MPLRISCPSCQAVVQCPDQLLGRRVRCTGCQQIFDAEDPGKDVAMDVIVLAEKPPVAPPLSRPVEPLPSVERRPVPQGTNPVVWIVLGVSALSLFLCCGGVGAVAFLRLSMVPPSMVPPSMAYQPPPPPVERPIRVDVRPPTKPDPVDPQFVRLAGYETVQSVAFTNKGQSLVAADKSGHVHFWSPTTGERKKTIKLLVGTLFSMAATPDGKLLACSTDCGTILVFDPESPQWQGTDSNIALANSVSVAISPDGQTVAGGRLDWKVSVWDVPSRKERFPPRPAKEQVLSVAFSPDGKTLASGSIDRVVKLWEPTTGQEICVIGKHQPAEVPWDGYRAPFWSMRSLAFTPDGNLLASASNDNAVILWDTAKRQKTATLSHNDPVLSVAVSPNGQYLASGTSGGAVTLWDLETHEKRASLKPNAFARFGDGAILAVAFSPDGNKLAVARGQDVEVWDLGQQLKR